MPAKKQFKNQFILVCLCGICVLLICVIFFISSHAAAKSRTVSDTVTAAQVQEAYAFLNQSQAVSEAAKLLDEPCTYGAYRQFLEYLNVWEAAELSDLLDWEQQKKEALSAWQLSQTRAQVAELFKTGTYESVQPAVSAVQESDVVHMPRVDASTNIRVLLLQDGACVGDEVYVSANAPYTVKFQGVTRRKKRNKIVRIGRLGLQVGETAVVSSKKGKVYLAGQDGERHTLGYCGKLQITRYEDGYAIVNVVPIEDYLCGVVQSEMPAYFETEALKAQVVCARTYIVLQLMQDNYPQYGADVDDSVQYQVYNKTAPDARVVAAVREAYGQILTKDDLPAETYFFSTSAGVTSGRELWGLPRLDYLQPVRGNADDQSVPDLSKEKAFRAFIGKQAASDYDSGSSYYRWRALLRPDEEQVRLKVLERNASGAVSRLRIRTQSGEQELTNEHEIRRALGKWISELWDKDGDKLTAGKLLPSAYFYVQPVEDGIVLFGGGLGHGIGMSQYGANGCAQAGMDMEQILQTYYPGTVLYRLYTKDE